MKQPVALFWFRRDLRLHDNHGFFKALNSDCKVLPVFIFDSERSKFLLFIIIYLMFIDNFLLIIFLSKIFIRTKVSLEITKRSTP